MAQPVTCSWCGNHYDGPLQWSQHPCAIIQAIIGFNPGDQPGTIDQAPMPKIVNSLMLLGSLLSSLHSDLQANIAALASIQTNVASIASTLSLVASNKSDVHNAFRAP